MKLIIAGSRHFTDYAFAEKTIAEMNMEITEVVCGKARGADTVGEDWALAHQVPVKYFPAQWDLYGNAAGSIRNAEMAEYGDYLLAFWDGKSRGTKNMIECMKKLGKHGKVIIV